MTFSPTDMSVLEKRIIDLFAASPALKAKDIARQLGVETKEVNSFLYSNKGKLLEKDEAHVWRLRSNQTGVASGVNDSQSTEGDPNAPNCPKCGVKMLLKTARQGPNKGNQFYGCPNWRTTCKGQIINITENSIEREGQTEARENMETSGATASELEDSPQSVRIPVMFEARPRIPDYQARFYESVALPRDLLKRSADSYELKRGLEDCAKWRVDFPLDLAAPPSSEVKFISTIARKILLRGYLTCCSPNLERKLQQLVMGEAVDGSTAAQNLVDHAFFNYLAPCPSNEGNLNWFDGDGSESKFYSSILPKYLGRNFSSFVTPQVSLSSLLNDKSRQDDFQSLRVDFFIKIKSFCCVVEIDGAEHEANAHYDSQRDAALRESGIEVFRIPNSEVSRGAGPQLERFINAVSPYREEWVDRLDDSNKLAIATKLAHQIQVATLDAVTFGCLSVKEPTPKVKLELDVSVLPDSHSIFKAAIDDLNDLLKNICVLYEYDEFSEIVCLTTNSIETENCISLNYTNKVTGGVANFLIQNFTFHKPLVYREPPTAPRIINNTSRDNLRFFLEYIFGHKDFNEGQYQAIERALNGKDTIVLLPTGGGKSVAYQLTSMLTPGVMIVVAPLVALINDQIDNLARAGIGRVMALTGQIRGASRGQLSEAFAEGQFLFCYVAPERFQIQEFRDSVNILKQQTPISVIAIDEAHCVSEWGHDFRTSYLNIGRITRELCATRGFTPPLLALTGTASHAVLRDVQRELKIQEFDAIITPSTFDRAEIDFSVFEAEPKDKFIAAKSALIRYLPDKFNISEEALFAPRGKNTYCGIIFCPHVNGPQGIMTKVKEFESDMGINIKPYSGSAPKGWREDNWTKVKNQTAKEFKSNKFPVLAATKSFGMGIDKPNVRYTMHMGLPHSIEQFYQEAGRAGRDRRHAESILVYTCKDTRRADHLLSPETPPEKVAAIVNTTKWADKDDVINALWFHCNSFQGRSQEFEVYNALAQKIPNLNLRDTHKVSLERDELKPFEKVLHRLTILGVVSDYTIEYKKNEFTVDLSGADQETILDSYKEYIAGYNRGRVADEVAKLTPSLNEPILNFIGRSYGVLIEFIYETIEKGRRRGLREMVTLADNAANSADQSSQVREKILAYLQTAYNEEIEDILNETNTIENLRASILGKTDPASGELLGGLQSPIQSRDMRGQVGRYLESYPDHPGLLLLRGISELFCTDFDVRDVIENIQAGLSQASAYGLSDRDVKSLLCQAVLESSNRFPGRADTVAALLLDGLNDVEFGRELLGMPNASPLVVYRSSQFLLNKNTQKAKTLV